VWKTNAPILPGWEPRKAQFGKSIGRMYTVSVATGELYYLRLLLLHVKGPKSFQDLRTVDGSVHGTFKEACIAMQLLADDSQWENCILDAVTYQMPSQLRDLFAMVCVFGEPTSPLQLWETFKADLIEDYIRNHSPV